MCDFSLMLEKPRSRARHQETKKPRNQESGQETKKPRNQETGQWTRNAHVETFHAECFDSRKFAGPALKLKEISGVSQLTETPKHAC